MSEKIEKEFDRDHREHTLVVEGRNAVLEAFRSGKPIDKVFVLDGCQDGPIRTIIREAKKHDRRGGQSKQYDERTDGRQRGSSK